MEENKELLFYGIEEQEILNQDPSDTLDSYFSILLKEDIARVKYPFKVYVFKPKEIQIDGEEIINDILENLDENYGDPDGDFTTPTDNMKKYANLLAKAIKQEYVPWQCEKTGEVLEYSKEDISKELGYNLK